MGIELEGTKVERCKVFLERKFEKKFFHNAAVVQDGKLMVQLVASGEPYDLEQIVTVTKQVVGIDAAMEGVIREFAVEFDGERVFFHRLPGAVGALPIWVVAYVPRNSQLYWMQSWYAEELEEELSAMVAGASEDKVDGGE